MHRRAAVHEAGDRAPDDDGAGHDEDRALGKSGKMLGFAVPVLMSGVGGPDGDADGEEGQPGSDEIGSGVRGLRDEAEAVRREAGAELEPDQRERGEDGPERSFPLGLHARKRT